MIWFTIEIIVISPEMLGYALGEVSAIFEKDTNIDKDELVII